jgi:predicted ATP-grasp superfamily ATP-dependent carboligase
MTTTERQPPAVGTVGALVIGGDYQGLAIVRSLGRAGVPVIVIDDESPIARHSRYALGTIRTADLRDQESVIETILDVGKRLGLEGWLLLATRDEVVAALARGRELLAESFLVPTPPWDVVQEALDKRRMNAVAARAGIPTPQTWHPDSAAALGEIRPARWPLLVKPAVKHDFIYATNVKGWLARDRDELETRFRAAAAVVGATHVMVQDVIPGSGASQYAFCAFFKDGASLGRMTVRRRRQWPADLGRSSTFAETIEEPELTELSERFLRAIGYYGLVELEYKHDAADGRYKLLDVNPRTWGYHSLGQAAGVDFPLLLYRDQIGLDVQPAVARAGVTWVRLLTDTPAALGQIVRRRLGFQEYVRSLRRVDAEAVLSWDDPRPAVAQLALVPHLVKTRRPVPIR